MADGEGQVHCHHQQGLLRACFASRGRLCPEFLKEQRRRHHKGKDEKNKKKTRLIHIGINVIPVTTMHFPICSDPFLAVYGHSGYSLLYGCYVLPNFLVASG
jgi:hypothetical protein